MKRIERKCIDWERTGIRLYNLRSDNLHLRRYVCWLLNVKKGNCSGECQTCEFDMDRSISRAELGAAMQVSDSVIYNWENGVTPPSLEDLLLYSEMARVDLSEIIVYEKS